MEHSSTAATPDPDDSWVRFNDHIDHQRGFVSTGITDTIERRFGVLPRFGMAGGCVNMLFTVETGHIVNITDIGSADLTAVDQRTVAHGITVVVYTQNGFEAGEPLKALSEQTDTANLPDLIARALRATVEAAHRGTAATMTQMTQSRQPHKAHRTAPSIHTRTAQLMLIR